MVEEAKREEIEASGDALIIADGLYAVADAIREMTAMLKESNSEPQGSDEESYMSYLSGAPVNG